MKKAEGAEEKCKWNCKQLLCKGMMCSCYGKFALCQCRQVSHELTTNEDTIMEMVANGTISDFKEKEINGKRFYEFSGLV